MKNQILVLGTIIVLIVGSTFLVSCGSENEHDSSSTDQNEVEADHDHESITATFACSMHPEIIGSEGDKCSKCNMALVASTDSEAEMKGIDAGALHSCPMHPEITGQEGDKCSKCGMDLTLADASDIDKDSQE